MVVQDGLCLACSETPEDTLCRVVVRIHVHCVFINVDLSFVISIIADGFQTAKIVLQTIILVGELL